MLSSFFFSNRILFIGMNLLCILSLGRSMDVEAQPQPQPQPQVHPHTPPASLPTFNALREGRSSLSFQLPTPSFNLNTGSQINQDPTILGFWHCMTARLNVGINLGVSVSQNSVVVQEAMNGNSEVRQDQMSTEFILAPTFKYYTRTQSTVALYFLGQMHFQTFSDGDATTINDPDAMGDNTYNPKEDLELALILGFGTEWFPTQSFSLGGHIGLDFDLLRQNQAGIALSTFTSNLTAQIYF